MLPAGNLVKIVQSCNDIEGGSASTTLLNQIMPNVNISSYPVLHVLLTHYQENYSL